MSQGVENRGSLISVPLALRVLIQAFVGHEVWSATTNVASVEAGGGIPKLWAKFG